MKNNVQFSVLMSVYKKEEVKYFIEALDSVINQTVSPSQIVLVRDGLVPQELQTTIDKYLEKYSGLFTYVPLEENGGLGKALRLGLTYCKYDFVARMDTDDICVSDRFEQQLSFLRDNPDVDIVGGDISEFSLSPDQVVDFRLVPKTHEEIVACLKKRCPFNHMTVMFKKEAIERANSYEDFYLFEDWYLWIRMYLHNAKFANLNKVLVNVRIGDMANRRGGIKYYKSYAALLKYMRKNKMIGGIAALKMKIIRFTGYVLLPAKLRKAAYKKFLRKSKNVQ
ncbi:MAG: glycosyltransferase [Clostridia bacterium]|nr:glycosyltransferase [Clostridia bacterium]